MCILNAFSVSLSIDSALELYEIVENRKALERESKLKSLGMQTAVDDEDYESAAALRDAINEQKEEMNIKPCPFCNSDAVLKVTEDQSDYCYDKKTGKVKEYYDVKCTNEDCYLSYGADWNHPNPEEIIELWNTRNKKESRDKILNDLGI